MSHSPFVVSLSNHERIYDTAPQGEKRVFIDLLSLAFEFWLALFHKGSFFAIQAL
jgi:hypothetical protein